MKKKKKKKDSVQRINFVIMTWNVVVFVFFVESREFIYQLNNL